MESQGSLELRLQVKGFFTVNFTDLDDQKRVFENRLYFMNNTGLFNHFWEECYNLEKEKFLVAPIWVHLSSLLEDLWELDMLEDIGNSIG